jgi:hypothetical protein
MQPGHRRAGVTVVADAGITAADPIPDDLRSALTKINNAGSGAH